LRAAESSIAERVVGIDCNFKISSIERFHNGTSSGVDALMQESTSAGGQEKMRMETCSRFN
jgi:hypothetical protein